MEFVRHAAGKLAYRRFGSGSEVWIFFHGFGQCHQDMLSFDKLRTSKQSYLFVDLIYHGQSSWNTSEKGRMENNPPFPTATRIYRHLSSGRLQHGGQICLAKLRAAPQTNHKPEPPRSRWYQNGPLVQYEQLSLWHSSTFQTGCLSAKAIFYTSRWPKNSRTAAEKLG